jgi:hypothetical protein
VWRAVGQIEIEDVPKSIDTSISVPVILPVMVCGLM